MLLKASAEVMRWDEFGNRIRYEDVWVEVKGSSRVSVMVAGQRDPFELLPLAGGTPAVWNVSLMFFQLSLLGAYLYAHVAIRRLGNSA